MLVVAVSRCQARSCPIGFQTARSSQRDGVGESDMGGVCARRGTSIGTVRTVRQNSQIPDVTASSRLDGADRQLREFRPLGCCGAESDVLHHLEGFQRTRQ